MQDDEDQWKNLNQKLLENPEEKMHEKKKGKGQRKIGWKTSQRVRERKKRRAEACRAAPKTQKPTTDSGRRRKSEPCQKLQIVTEVESFRQ